jgi:hypothetical protein
MRESHRLETVQIKFGGGAYPERGAVQRVLCERVRWATLAAGASAVLTGKKPNKCQQTRGIRQANAMPDGNRGAIIVRNVSLLRNDGMPHR